jgi:hypothetical protein
MAEHISNAAGFLLALLLLGCDEEQNLEQSEPPNILDCSASCEDGEIKAWYQKKYGEPITDFELSASAVFYDVWQVYAHMMNSYPHRERTSVRKTATGASAYSYGKGEAELSMEEWHDFLRNISKLRIGEWERKYSRDIPRPADSSLSAQYKWLFNKMDSWGWAIEIRLPSDTLKSSGLNYATPANYHYLKKILGDIEYKIKEKSLTAEEKADRKQKAEREKERNPN